MTNCQSEQGGQCRLFNGEGLPLAGLLCVKVGTNTQTTPKQLLVTALLLKIRKTNT